MRNSPPVSVRGNAEESGAVFQYRSDVQKLRKCSNFRTPSEGVGNIQGKGDEMTFCTQRR